MELNFLIGVYVRVVRGRGGRKFVGLK